MDLRLPDRTLQIHSGRPAIMGILNVGNDSVADSSQFPDASARVERGRELVRQGAEIIDVGAISGRTDTPAISIEQEIGLLCPVIRELARDGIIVSVDTWRPPVVAAILEAGAAIVNDISGLADPAVARLAAEAGAGLVLMHTRAAPKQRHFPGYADPAADVIDFLKDRLTTAQEHGLASQQAIIDPGLDYAKTPEESVAVLRRLDQLQALDRPILLAVSRKYFLGVITGRQPEDRLPGTLAAIHYGLGAGAAIVRVHDVAAVADFLSVSAGLEATAAPEFKGDLSDESLMWIAPKPAKEPAPQVAPKPASQPAGAGRDRGEDSAWRLSDEIAYLLDTPLQAGEALLGADGYGTYDVEAMLGQLRRLGATPADARPSEVIRAALAHGGITSFPQHWARDLAAADAAWRAAQRS